MFVSRSDRPGRVRTGGTRAGVTGEPGLEPGMRHPKCRVLPITPLPNGTSRLVRPEGLLLLCRGAHLAALGAGLERRAAWRGDPEDAHRLEAEAELLAALGRGDIVAAELADTLEAVADRVAVGEELFGGRGDVAVVVEVGLDSRDQLGLVLLVVGGERLDRLRVEALELARV